MIRQLWSTQAITFSLALGGLFLLSGCNNIAVVKSNIQRTRQAKNEPKQRPMHPYALPRGAASNSDGPQLPELDAPEDQDEEIQQTSAESSPRTATAMIAGRVVDGSGRPQPNVSVVATPTRRPGGSRAGTTTDARGNFVLRGLEPGQRYLILATAIHSATSLIGRTSATPPDQDVVVEIARPFTANHSPPRTPQPGQPQPTTRTTPPAPANGPTRNAQGSFHRENPFAENPPPPVSRSPQSNADRLPSRQTREEILAQNRLQSPWDTLPQPPRSNSSVATQARGPQTSGDRTTTWKPVAKLLPELDSDGRAPSLADAALSDIPASDSQAQEPDQPPDEQPPLPDPRKPLSQPIELPSDPKVHRPRAKLTKANVPLETEEPQKPAATAAPDTSAYSGPTCEFDAERLVDFQLPDLHGQPVSFKQINRRLVLIDFWGTWCGYCLKSIPHLVDLQRRYGPQGLQVVGIAYEQGDTTEGTTRVRKVQDQLGMNYTVLMGDGSSKCPVREKFGIHMYPTLVLLDKSGKVLWRSEGPDQKDHQQLEKLLKTQLAGPTNGYN